MNRSPLSVDSISLVTGSCRRAISVLPPVPSLPTEGNVHPSGVTTVPPGFATLSWTGDPSMVPTGTAVKSVTLGGWTDADRRSRISFLGWIMKMGLSTLDVRSRKFKHQTYILHFHEPPSVSRRSRGLSWYRRLPIPEPESRYCKTRSCDDQKYRPNWAYR